jgi:hypothetical protein
MNFASLINFSRYSFPAKFHFHLKQYIYTMARLTPRITRAHDTLTISRPQSAKGDFKKRQGWGVGLMPLLAGLPGCKHPSTYEITDSCSNNQNTLSYKNKNPAKLGTSHRAFSGCVHSGYF